MIDLTLFAQQGYDAEEDATVEFTHGSSAFVAWRVGRWLRQHGGIRPTQVFPESGYAVRVDGVKVEIPAGATGEPRIASA
ncbi:MULTISPECIES: hypothetical protein [Caulobacter]|jgi:hypothetical protein|uniref:Uncharacterized protein n=1 Tax=Caulobacter vibrioides OR37 TaxID=1292034 RepID=R0D0G9_CAUVI|nr:MULTISPECIES: hypothetical protein [Caulobacter]ENZ82151.1 hypothetical protein OR37_01963 [Caulobacter vibrioides OR37]MBQ1559852.1 hypothetical protein [Caulobacter sp.]